MLKFPGGLGRAPRLNGRGYTPEAPRLYGRGYDQVAASGKTWSVWRAVVFALLGLLAPLFALEPGIVSPAAPRPDRIIIRPTAAASPVALQRLHAQLGTRVARTFERKGGGDVVALPTGLAVPQAIAAFQRSGLVDYAEPDFVLRALVAPNDFNYQNQDQWNLHNTGIYGGKVGADIMAEPGWDLKHDASNIVVAVVDSGIRYTHEDLAANMWVNPGETGLDAQGRDKRTNGIDDDGDGYVDDVYGINVVAHTGNPMDDWGHGTHVAGIVGGVGNNTVGIAGVAWRVKLMAVKFIDGSGNYSVSDAVTALDYARVHGARIITASWGGYAFDSQALRDAFTALHDAGIIVTAAAGNDNNNNDVTPLYPASYSFDNLVAVAATDRTDARATYSNYGAHTVHLGAPGSPVFSTWAGSDSDYRYNEGTSMAAPHVAGACALLWTRFPSDTPQQILQRVLANVDPLPSLTGITRTNGRLNLAAALSSGTASSSPPAAPTQLAATATSSSSIALTWIDNSTTETGFEIQSSTDNVNFAAAATVATNVTSATIGGLAASTTYYFRVRAVQNALASSFTNTVTATTQAASTTTTGTWQSTDIGAVAAGGSASESNGVVTVKGSGADIWDYADEFQYRFQNWNGDGEIVARVTGLTNTNAWAKAGVMFRESLAANARHAFMCVSAAAGTAFQRRITAGGASDSTAGTQGSLLPRWVRLVRSGSTFTAYESGDGVQWAQVGTPLTLALPTSIYVGLAVTSHDDGVVCTGVFDNVRLGGGSSSTTVNASTALLASAFSSSQINLSWTDNSSNETGFEVERSPDHQTFTRIASLAANVTSYSDAGLAPATAYYYRVRAIAGTATSTYSNVAGMATAGATTGSVTWSQADVGAVGLAGSGDASGNPVTIRGAGSDVWDTADAFHFAYRQVSGDCVLQAQVSSMTNTNGWAKAGVMIRESLAAGSSNVFAFLTPGQGIGAQARTATGATTSFQGGAWWVTAPYWVRLVRTSNHIVAYQSADGTSWTQVAAYDVTMNAAVYVGLAVTSHDATQLNTAVFANPTVQ